MSYVPTPIITGTPERPSVRARELGNRVRELISQYRQEHPEVSDRDVVQALGLARQSLGGTEAKRLVAIGSLLAGLGVFALAGFFLASGGGGLDGSVPAMAVAVLMVLAVLAVVAVRGRR